MQCVIPHGFDGIENGEAATAEHFEVDAQAAADHLCERRSLYKEQARACDQIFHQIDVTIVEAAFDDVGFAEAVSSGNVERDIYAALFEVARNVLPEIGELQSSTSGVGHGLTLFVTVAAKKKNEATDGICGIDAIADHRIPRGVAFDGLVLAERSQQIGKGLPGNIFSDYGFAQSDEDGMRRAARVTGIKFALPPIKEFEGALFLRNLVAEIVGPAAIGIKIVEMLVQILREQPGDDIEIFVMVRSEPARVLLRRCRGAPIRGSALGNFEFTWAQHIKRDSSLRRNGRRAKRGRRTE